MLLKNASRTSGQLGELTTIQPSSPKTAMTLPTPTSTPRRPDGRDAGASGDPRWKGGVRPSSDVAAGAEAHREAGGRRRDGATA